jgi:hypothetical protein
MYGIEMEVATSRMAEIVLESTPSAIVQINAYVRSTKKSKAALASIIVSALTTGFVSATLAYDADVNPKKRRITPEFYG